MKILLIIQDRSNNRFALIPSYLLEDEEGDLTWLDNINGKDIYDDNTTDEERDGIRYLFDKLGIGPFNLKMNKNLSKYLNPSFPMTIDKIVIISWSK